MWFVGKCIQFPLSLYWYVIFSFRHLDSTCWFSFDSHLRRFLSQSDVSLASACFSLVIYVMMSSWSTISSQHNTHRYTQIHTHKHTYTHTHTHTHTHTRTHTRTHTHTHTNTLTYAHTHIHTHTHLHTYMHTTKRCATRNSLFTYWRGEVFRPNNVLHITEKRQNAATH